MTFDTSSQLTVGLILSVLLLFGLWLIHFRLANAGIVDVGWTLSLGLLSVFYGLTMPAPTVRSGIVLAIASLWSMRLSTHLLRDRIVERSEDARYKRLRESWGLMSRWYFLAFFIAQGLLAWIFGFAFFLAMHRSGRLDSWDLAGITVWVIAIVGETTADIQLSLFRRQATNRGKTCRDGWWRFSRHPNYFFEWLHWWAYVAIAWPSRIGWLTVFAPMLMLFFLFKVTGIPATEAQAINSRGDDYRQYQKTTSAFFPWFPR